MFLRRGDGLEVTVLEKYGDTIKRLLQDGWMQIEALTAAPATPAAPVAPTETEDEMRARIRAELLAEMAGTPAVPVAEEQPAPEVTPEATPETVDAAEKPAKGGK